MLHKAASLILVAILLVPVSASSIVAENEWENPGSGTSLVLDKIDLKFNLTPSCEFGITASSYASSAEHIDEIILVGGSSYMPMIKERIQKEFNCELRLDMFEPDRAVSQGAALHAAKLQGDEKVKIELGEDMSARSYGTDVKTENGTMVQNILLRTDPLIYENTFVFYTANEGQTSVSISLYENTSTESHVSVKKSTLLIDKFLEWDTPVPTGTEILMHVTRNKEGIVRVIGECAGTKEEFCIETKGLLNQNEVEAMKRSLLEKRV